MVWVNCTNQFDASAGFGGYRESGFGREGGREGMFEYLKLVTRPVKTKPAPKVIARKGVATLPIDRTAKLFIGGKQARPDGGYSIPVLSPTGVVLGQVGDAIARISAMRWRPPPRPNPGPPPPVMPGRRSFIIAPKICRPGPVNSPDGCAR